MEEPNVQLRELTVTRTSVTTRSCWPRVARRPRKLLCLNNEELRKITMVTMLVSRYVLISLI